MTFALCLDWHASLDDKIDHFRIQKKCYFLVKFVVSVIIFVRDCRTFWPSQFEIDNVGCILYKMLLIQINSCKNLKLYQGY